MTQTFGCSPPIIPVDDLKRLNGDISYSIKERQLRCKLAAVFRVVELNGWTMGVPNHITVRLKDGQDEDHFLINPSGLHYSEVTASCLHKIELNSGQLVDSGATNFTFNRGLNLHTAIYRARTDVNAVLHFHYPPCVAVASLKSGFLVTSQEAAILGGVSYYDYKRLVIDRSEGEAMARTLGPKNKIMFLRNHGIVACGESLEEMLYLTTNLVFACETQIRLAQMAPEHIYTLNQTTTAKVAKAIREIECMKVDHSKQNAIHNGNHNQKNGDNGTNYDDYKPNFTIWEQEFEIQMRLLDRQGYNTGYIYRNPLTGINWNNKQ